MHFGGVPHNQSAGDAVDEYLLVRPALRLDHQLQRLDNLLRCHHGSLRIGCPQRIDLQFWRLRLHRLGCQLSERLGLPSAGQWEELVNTDAAAYAGSGVGNLGSVEAVEGDQDGQPAYATLVLPPLATVWLRKAG